MPKYRNKLVGMIPVVSFWLTCEFKNENDLWALIAFHSLRLVTPITSTFHHSAWPPFLVVMKCS